MRWGRTHHNEKRIGAHVHIDIWQNQYNIVKLKNKIKKRKKKEVIKRNQKRFAGTVMPQLGCDSGDGERTEEKLAVQTN